MFGIYQCQQCVMSSKNECSFLDIVEILCERLWKRWMQCDPIVTFVTFDWFLLNGQVWQCYRSHVINKWDFASIMKIFYATDTRNIPIFFWSTMHQYIKMRIRFICVQLVTHIHSSVNDRFIIQQFFKFVYRYIKQQLKFG